MASKFSTKINTYLSHYIDDILTNISNDYGIPLNDLAKYVDKETIHNKSPSTSCCRARKQDGNRCTRKSKPNSIFCGKHITNRKYGCINNETYIELKYFNHGDSSYYTDEYNIVYKKLNDNKYEIVGIKLSNDIQYLNSLSIN